MLSTATRTFFCLIAALALLLAACGPSTPTEEEAAVQEDTEAEEPAAAEEEAAPTDTPEPTPTEEPQPHYRIVFVANLGDDPNVFNLYTINPDGSDLQPLTTDFLFVEHPTWSPDGTQVAFGTNDGGSWRIFTISAEGQALTQITDFSSATAGWFPSGDRLVFNSDHQAEPADVPDLYAMNLDGSNLVEIIDMDATSDYFGRMSASQILFSSDRAGNMDIYVADIDGGNVIQLTDDPAADFEGVWSPDASQILFTSDRSGNNDLWVMDADGSNLVQITDDPGSDLQCAWSPDGNQIVFVSDRSGDIDLWIIDADGSNPVQLTQGPQLELFPDW